MKESTPLDVGCLACGAAVGAPCTSLGKYWPKGNTMKSFHKKRIDAWHHAMFKAAGNLR